MELYLPPIKLDRNPINGRFLKGHIPYTRGKKWEEWMDLRKANRIKKNLRIGGIPNTHFGDFNKRKVVGVIKGKGYFFESLTDASKKIGLPVQNIGLCCQGKRKHSGGYMWFYFDSDEWISLINSAELKI